MCEILDSHTHRTCYCIGPRNIVPNLLDREKATTKQLKTKGADATKARRMRKPKPNEKEEKRVRSEETNGRSAWRYRYARGL